MKDPYLIPDARILDIKPETRDTKTYTLAFVHPSIQEEFNFLPGQFILISVLGVGQAPFSLSSSPLAKKSFSTTIRKIGSLTTTLDKLKPGDKVQVGGPFGNGWPVNPMKGKNVLIIGGGLGLSPLWPVIHVIEARRSDYKNLEILYGAHSPEDCVFIEEYRRLADIENTCASFTVDKVPAGTEWSYNIGLVTSLLNQMESKPDNTVVLICGPGIMMRFVVQDLLKIGFSTEQIYVSLERRMRCGFGQCGHCQIGSKFVCKDGPVFKYADIKGLPDLNI